MIDGSISRRYARALFGLGQENGTAEALGNELQILQNALNDAGDDIRAVLVNPTFTAAERRDLLERILRDLPISATTANFARLLLDKGRFGALPEIQRDYTTLADEAANRLRAKIIASGDMSNSMQDKVAQALSKATGKQVIVSVSVDESLLGGIIAHVGSRVYDASLKTRLDNIQRALIESAPA